MPTGIVHKKAGQSQKLTTLLRDLVRRYPKTVGIFSEFLQNADDAQAKVVKFILDRRTYPSDRLPAPQMSALLGPALLVYNDSTFTDDDFESIQEIGDSGKAMAVAKTGRFGFGFNSAYNVTDHPTFVSGQWMYVFDPHRDAVPDEELGVAYTLTRELWAEYPDLLAPFIAGGLATKTTEFEGTVFRLPLRTAERAKYSKIRNEPFTAEEFHTLADRFADFGSASLLFLKHVLRIEIAEIDASTGARRQLLVVNTENPEEVAASRALINGPTMEARPSLLDDLSAAPPKALFEHKLSVTRGDQTSQARWLIASGIYFDKADELLATAKAMVEAGEKAVPWVGVAVELDITESLRRPKPVAGQAFCFLPLPITTSLPVHVNGFFDLGSDRRTLTHDPNSVGRDELRVRWNSVLCRRSVPLAYRDVLFGLIDGSQSKAVTDFFGIWPDTGVVADEPIHLIAKGFYESVADDKVVLASTAEGQGWRSVGELWIPPAGHPLVQEALVADGFGIPDPPLPQHVVAGFEKADVTLDHLTPQELRGHLLTDTDISTGLESAPRACLRRREWVEELLRYCLSDDDGEEQLAGLPLALLADNKLHTFGKFSWNWSFLAGEAERSLLVSKPSWFIERDFAAATRLPASVAGHVSVMTPADLAVNLPVVLDPSRKGESTPWDAGSKGAPGAEWLAEVFLYLAEHHKEVLPKLREWKVKPPLLPDQHGRLCPAGLPGSPVLIPPEFSANRQLLYALDAFGLPRITAPEPLLDAVGRFAQAAGGNFIESLTGPTLAGLLKEFEPQWSQSLTTYQGDVHAPLLDFLSDDRWLAKPATLGALKLLRIFPTENGQLVKLTEPGVFFTPDAPPSITGDVKLLKLGRHNRWRPLLRVLGARPLDNATLILDVLLPQFPSCTSSQQVEVLRWLRDHVRPTVRQLEASNKPEAASDLRTRVAKAHLFRCADGTLRAARSVYDPKQQVVRDVLGETAAFVDASTYAGEWDEWLAFLDYLGMPTSPSPEDLLSGVDAIAAAGIEGPQSADRIDRLLQHLVERWNVLAEVHVADPTKGAALAPFGEAVGNRAWLRAESDPKRLARFACAATPERRLFLPRELFPTRSGHLCASQCPLSAHAKVGADVAKAIGMPSRVPHEVVLAHFDHILNKWDTESGGGIAPKVLGESLRRLYARLGGAVDDVAAEDGDAPPQEEQPAADLKARFAGRPCLWNYEPEQPRFWRPEHVFRTKITCFGSFRASLKFKELPLDRGYESLGRRDEPSPADFVAFLRDVADAFPDGIPVDVVGSILEAEARLAQAVAAANETFALALEDVSLLSSEFRMVPADAAYYCDADWHQQRLEPGRVALLYPGSDYGLVRSLGVNTLSGAIEERLLDAYGPVTDEYVLRRCAHWQETLCSTEFREGLLRLIRCSPENSDVDADLDWLHSVRVKPVKIITTELLLDRGAGPMVVGTGECDVFTDRSRGDMSTTIYLAYRGDGRSAMSLTRALVRLLAPLHMSRQLELQEMVAAEPSQVHAVLTSLRVPLIRAHEVLKIEQDADDREIDLQSDDFQFETADSDANSPADSGDLEVPADTDDTDGDADDTLVEENAEVQPGSTPHDCAAGTPSGAPPPAATTTPPPAAAPEKEGRPSSKAPGVGQNGATHSGPGSTATAMPGSAAPLAGNTGAPGGAPATAPGSTAATRPSQPGAGPPTRDTHGQRTPTQRSPSPRRGRAVTYAVPEGREPKAPRDPADDDQPVNMRIAQAAVDHALKLERESLGRKAEPQKHNNEGYDILSSLADGTDVRYIEVKGIDGPWMEDGVPVSKPQFKMGQKFKESYWLYVVENARSPDAEVHCIQNPTEKVTQFRYDVGWKALATPVASRIVIAGPQPSAQGAVPSAMPAAGGRLRWSDGRTGKILTVQQRGKFSHVEAVLDDGSTVGGLFDPSRMQLLAEG